MESMDIKDIFRNMSKYPIAVKNNGGGYFNHTLYWENMKAHGGAYQPVNYQKLSKAFSSFDEF